jgi:hypothetical protein
MFEPTVETGCNDLVQLQQFTGAPYTQTELELVYRLYRARKEHAGDAATKALLDQASADLSGLEVQNARAILDQVDPPGDFDNDGDADGADLLKWQQQLGARGLYPMKALAADGNADGVVNGTDLALWQTSVAAATSAASAVPEPTSAALFITAILVARSRTLTMWR